MIEPNAWVIGWNEFIRLLFAVFIGGLIGIERSFTTRPPDSAR